MKYLIVGIFLLTGLCFALGKWTKMVGRSGDERAGSVLPYVLATLFGITGLCLLAGLSVAHLFFP